MITDPAQVVVANLPAKEQDKDVDDLSFLNAPPDELDSLPVRPEAPTEPVKAAEPVATPAPEATPPPPTPTPPAAISHPSTLVDAALAIGFTERQIAATPTDVLLDFIVRENLRASMQVEPTKPAAQEETDDAILDYLEKEVGADKKLVGLLRKKFKRMEELEATGNEVKAIKEREQIRTQRTSEDAIDHAFEQMGAKFEKLFGKGGLRELTDDGAKAKRLAVFKNAGVDLVNDPPVLIQRKITKSAQAIYGDVVEEPKPKANAYADPKQVETPPGKVPVKDWDEAALGKPAAAKPRPSKGEKAAAEHVREFLKERGIYAGDHVNDLDGVPN